MSFYLNPVVGPHGNVCKLLRGNAKLPWPMELQQSWIESLSVLVAPGPEAGSKQNYETIQCFVGGGGGPHSMLRNVSVQHWHNCV